MTPEGMDHEALRPRVGHIHRRQAFTGTAHAYSWWRCGRGTSIVPVKMWGGAPSANQLVPLRCLNATPQARGERGLALCRRRLGCTLLRPPSPSPPPLAVAVLSAAERRAQAASGSEKLPVALDAPLGPQRHRPRCSLAFRQAPGAAAVHLCARRASTAAPAAHCSRSRPRPAAPRRSGRWAALGLGPGLRHTQGHGKSGTCCAAAATLHRIMTVMLTIITTIIITIIMVLPRVGSSSHSAQRGSHAACRAPRGTRVARHMMA